MAVCKHCNDTHRMDLGERLGVVLCTHCPRPCSKCGGGGLCCKTTPCGCPCHVTPTWMKHQEALNVAAAEPRASIFWPAMCLEPRVEKALLQFWYLAGRTPSGKPPERSIFWVQAADGARFKITIEPVKAQRRKAAEAPPGLLPAGDVEVDRDIILLDEKEVERCSSS